MATSTCPKCDSTSFEIQVFEILRAEYKHLCVQCAKCGAVVGILDYYNIGNILVAQNKALEAIADKLGIEVNLLTQQTRAEGRILPDASVTYWHRMSMRKIVQIVVALISTIRMDLKAVW